MPDKDPYGAFNFIVEVDGSPVAAFTEVSGLEYEVQVIEYRDGSDVTPTVRKVPGLVKYANIVLKRGITADHDFWDWVTQPLSGNVEKRDGLIAILGADRTPVASWQFTKGWPCKYVGPNLSAETNEVAIETVEICHEGLHFVER